MTTPPDARPASNQPDAELAKALAYLESDRIILGGREIAEAVRTIAAAARKTLAPVEPKELAEALATDLGDMTDDVVLVLAAAARRCQEAEQKHDFLQKWADDANKELDAAAIEKPASWSHAWPPAWRIKTLRDDRDKALAELARLAAPHAALREAADDAHRMLLAIRETSFDFKGLGGDDGQGHYEGEIWLGRVMSGLEKALAAQPDAPQAKEPTADELREAKDAAYKERDKLVCALSKLFPSWLSRHPGHDTSWEDDWRWIVFVQLPAGQAAWHIHDSEREWFAHLAIRENEWDGHDNSVKYRRLAALTQADSVAAAAPKAPEPQGDEVAALPDDVIEARCAYCGHRKEVSRDWVAVDRHIVQHNAECKKHPLRALEQQLSEARATIAEQGRQLADAKRDIAWAMREYHGEHDAVDREIAAARCGVPDIVNAMNKLHTCVVLNQATIKRRTDRAEAAEKQLAAARAEAAGAATLKAVHALEGCAFKEFTGPWGDRAVYDSMRGTMISKTDAHDRIMAHARALRAELPPAAKPEAKEAT